MKCQYCIKMSKLHEQQAEEIRRLEKKLSLWYEINDVRSASEVILKLEDKNQQQAEQIERLKAHIAKCESDCWPAELRAENQRLKDAVKANLAYLMRRDELNTTHVKANLIIQNEQALAAQPQKEESDG